jgi:PiT family inorganic phosphate transporter
MSEAVLTHPIARRAGPQLNGKPHPAGIVLFLALLLLGIGFAVHGIHADMQAAGAPPLAVGAFAMLGLALLIALGFEFVNGFHDTANAVATVIYTHSLPAQVAVVYSGCWNLIGVLTSSGAVAFTIITLLPVELILQVGSSAGYAMIFALLIAAIIWNLGTWVLGLPASSSHTLIGSIIGVGLANQLMAAPGIGASGVEWGQVVKVFYALLLSPLVGFVGSAGMLLAMKALVKSRALYEAPDTSKPPPTWIRGLLILTCTGVSFGHGSNDGQKGMGLIMLILIGGAPTAYSLNHAMPASHTPQFVEVTHQAQQAFAARAPAGSPVIAAPQARQIVTAAIRDKSFAGPNMFSALASLSGDIARQVQASGGVAQVPAVATQNVRNDMFLVSEAVRQMQKAGLSVSSGETKAWTSFKGELDASTKFIPTWVKVTVAIALGLGTMVGWKRIVVTVGEKIGKSHLTYGQGASAELIAAATIIAADQFGLPVSTTHVLSSGIAGTMMANGSGLQWSTVRSIALAWVLTLPVAALLSGSLFFLLRQFS